MNLALAYYKSARPNEAIRAPQAHRGVRPQARNAYLVLADCYLQTGQDQEVVALLKPREAMFGDDLAYAFLLGTALLRTGDEVEGQKYVDRVFGAGESAEAHLLMGIAHLGQHDYRAAKTELQRAVQLNPQGRRRRTRCTAGRCWLLGEQDAAERAFRQELDLNVNDFEANLQLGNMRKSAQKFAEASLPRARHDDSSDRPHRAQAAREPAPADRQGRRGRRGCSKRSRRRRPISSKCTCSSPPPTTASDARTMRGGRRRSSIG